MHSGKKGEGIFSPPKKSGVNGSNVKQGQLLLSS